VKLDLRSQFFSTGTRTWIGRATGRLQQSGVAAGVIWIVLDGFFRANAIEAHCSRHAFWRITNGSFGSRN
jgi:hypothetical protein